MYAIEEQAGEEEEQIEEQSAFNKFAVITTLKGNNNMGPLEYFKYNKKKIIKLMKYEQTKMKLIFGVNMEKTDLKTGITIVKTAFFHSHIEIILSSTNVEDVYSSMIDRCLENMVKYQREGSNWRFKSVNFLEIHKAKYNPLRASSYIPLPKVLENKKAIINMKNKDQQCFKWAVLRALNPVSNNPQRVTKALKLSQYEYNWGKIEFPTPLKDIDIFEKLNKSLSVNVLGYEVGGVYPLRISKRKQNNNNDYINLLLITDEETGNTHYCTINNMSRLLSSQLSKHNPKKYICYHCLNYFGTEK